MGEQSFLATTAAFLAQAELQPQSIVKVGAPRIWSLVTCLKGS